MILNISSVYPSGFEKTGPAKSFKGVIDKNVKEQAITLLKENVAIQKIADKLNINYYTIAGWKQIYLRVPY